MSRNFQIESEMADGRMRSIYVPRVRGRSDGFHLTVFMRNKEELEAVLGVQGKVEGENLELWIDYGEVGEEGQEEHQGIVVICRKQ